MIELFKDKYETTLFFEKYAAEKNMTLFDSVLMFCAERDIDIEDIEKFFTPTFKEKLKLDYILSEGLKVSTIEEVI